MLKYLLKKLNIFLIIYTPLLYFYSNQFDSNSTELIITFIFLFARKVLEWGKDKKIIGKFFTWCLEKGEEGGEKLKKTAGNKGIFFALLIFVGIPLPGTGAWTGTLAASFLNLDFKTSISAVTLGVLLAGIIMSLGSKFVSILGWPGLIAIVIAIIIAITVSILLNKKRNKRTTERTRKTKHQNRHIPSRHIKKRRSQKNSKLYNTKIRKNRRTNK